ncbi:VCBS repeat-containing protein [bacterium]|nr:VCBS repeat-containing protein [bacterium]
MKTAAKVLSGAALALTLGFSLAPVSLAHSDNIDCDDLKVGQIPQSLRVDLDNDGRDEVICLKVFKKAEYGCYAKLMVTDTKGKVIWAGPEETNQESRGLLGYWMYGISDMKTVGDFNKDGRPELLICQPQSDVRPQVYAIWEWNGKGFQYKTEKCLINKDKSKDNFYWVNPVGDYGSIRWISNFKHDKNSLRSGNFQAQVIDIGVNSEGTMSFNSGEAIFTPASKDYLTVKEWLSNKQE